MKESMRGHDPGSSSGRRAGATSSGRDFEVRMTELDASRCWQLVGRARFGRVAFVVDGEVLVLPVNVAVDHERVLFRTGSHTLLARSDGASVAFEADAAERAVKAGWSVLVQGRLRDVTEHKEPRWDELLLDPWAPPPRERWMVIEPVSVCGREITRHRVSRDRQALPYMPPG